MATAASVRKKISLTSVLMLFACILLCHVSQAQSTPPARTPSDVDYTLPGAPMPDLLFMSYKDTATAVATGKRTKRKKEETQSGYYTLLSGNDLANNANLLVMIFSPECEHCNAVATMLENNAVAFKQSKLLLLTTNILSDLIPRFTTHHQLNQYPHTYIGFDSSQFAKQTFLYQPLPQINIYSPQRTLIKTFTGEVPFDSLRQYIQ